MGQRIRERGWGLGGKGATDAWAAQVEEIQGWHKGFAIRREVEGASGFWGGRDSLWKREFRPIESGWIPKLTSGGIGRLNFDWGVEFPTGLTGEPGEAGRGNKVRRG